MSGIGAVKAANLKHDSKKKIGGWGVGGQEKTGDVELACRIHYDGAQCRR
jgi:hypothetical protein